MRILSYVSSDFSIFYSVPLSFLFSFLFFSSFSPFCCPFVFFFPPFSCPLFIVRLLFFLVYSFFAYLFIPFSFPFFFFFVSFFSFCYFVASFFCLCFVFLLLFCIVNCSHQPCLDLLCILICFVCPFLLLLFKVSLFRSHYFCISFCICFAFVSEKNAILKTPNGSSYRRHKSMIPGNLYVTSALCRYSCILATPFPKSHRNSPLNSDISLVSGLSAKPLCSQDLWKAQVR